MDNELGKGLRLLGYLIGVNFEALVLIVGSIYLGNYLDSKWVIFSSWKWLLLPVAILISVKHYVAVITLTLKLTRSTGK